MCCIFGVGLLKGHKIKNKDLFIGLISVLAKEAEVGGRAASGVSLMREKTARIFKRPMNAGLLVTKDDYQDFMSEHVKLDDPADKLISVIGHTRLPTKGSPENNDNNHPINIDHIIGVHNGVIGNDDALFKNFDTQFDRVAEVDTEIIFQLLAHFSKKRTINTIDAIEKSSLYLKGSYACAAQNANHPYNLYLFRKSNPIRVFLVKSLGILMFATRETFVFKALKVIDHEPEVSEIELPSETGVSFNLHTKNFTKFIFPRNQKDD